MHLNFTVFVVFMNGRDAYFVFNLALITYSRCHDLLKRKIYPRYTLVCDVTQLGT